MIVEKYIKNNIYCCIISTIIVEKYIKNNIDCCIISTMIVVKVYKEQHLLLYYFNNDC